MGQRLNLEIRRNTDDDMPIANAYYHWSGYTESALELARYAADTYLELKDMKLSELNCAVAMLKSTGSGFPPDANGTSNYEKARREIDPSFFTDATSRNEGLTAIYLDDMSNIDSWAETFCTIYLEYESVSLSGVMFYEGGEDTYKKEYKDSDDYLPVIALPVAPYDPVDIPFAHIDSMQTFLAGVDRFFVYDNAVFSKIY